MTLHDFGFLGQGHYAHGTRANYRTGCRCVPCRSANACYETARARAKGRGSGIEAQTVDAGPARRRLEELKALSVGIRQAAKLAGLSVRTVQRIRTGASANIRPAVARAILGIQEPYKAGGVRVNGYTTRHYIESLLREDYVEADIARRLGFRGPTLRLGPNVTVRTARRVYRLWRRLTGEDIDIAEDTLAQQVSAVFAEAQGGSVFVDSRGVVRPDFHRAKRSV